jgi:hypothetical protein
MKIFSSNITGLSPVMKKTSPTKNNPRESKRRNKTGAALYCSGRKEELQTTNSNYKQELLTSMAYSYEVSSVGPPLPPGQKGTRRERHPVQVVVDSKVVGAATTIINMVSVIWNRRPMTSILNNSPGQKKWGITTGQPCTTTNVTNGQINSS